MARRFPGGRRRLGRGSSRGQARSEIEDALGGAFKNLAAGRSRGCGAMDWPGHLAAGFDGRGCVHAAPRPMTPAGDRNPGPVAGQRVSECGDKEAGFPARARAITAGMSRAKPGLPDFKPGAPSIRLRRRTGRRAYSSDL